MIPAIGYMLGSFVIARLAAQVSNAESVNSRGIAMLAITVTVVCLVYLVYLHLAAGEVVGQLPQAGG